VGPEQKLYRELKKATPNIIWNRIENLSILGMPDLLGYNKSGTFFTVELKVTKGRKIRFSPHQIAFHVKHPNNTFILVAARGPRSVDRYQMFRGSRITELVASGLELEACCLGLDAIRDFLYQLGA
jgi:Holliday junction resolvase